MQDGDLVLMDFAPECTYYTSDIGRMWPVNGAYAPWQRELYGYIVEYHKVLLSKIRPGVMPDQVMDEAAEAMREVWERWAFSKEVHREGARRTLDFRGHLSHPVGMAVHDVGRYEGAPLQPGQVFAVDPQLRVPEEQLYIRYEDLVARPEQELRRICDFVGVEYDPIMLEDRSGATGVAAEHEWWKGDATGPLDRSRTGRWTEEMPPEVQHYAALNLGPLLEEHGYGEAAHAARSLAIVPAGDALNARYDPVLLQLAAADVAVRRPIPRTIEELHLQEPLVFFGVVGLFPSLFPSSINPRFDLTAFNASSSPLTLKIMLTVVIIFVPIVLVYQIWAYNLFKTKVEKEDLIY